MPKRILGVFSSHLTLMEAAFFVLLFQKHCVSLTHSKSKLCETSLSDWTTAVRLTSGRDFKRESTGAESWPLTFQVSYLLTLSVCVWACVRLCLCVRVWCNYRRHIKLWGTGRVMMCNLISDGMKVMWQISAHARTANCRHARTHTPTRQSSA